jgi:CRP-like cAMP-binding protein
MPAPYAETRNRCTGVPVDDGTVTTVRDRHDEKIDQLAKVPLFAGLPRRHLERIAQLCTRADVAAGTVLCREGSPGHEFFVVVDGTATVTVGGATVNSLGPGDFFGEMALLDAGPRMATVTADSALVALVLSSAEFSSLLREEPQVAVNLLPVVGARIRASRPPT